MYQKFLPQVIIFLFLVVQFEMDWLTKISIPKSAHNLKEILCKKGFKSYDLYDPVTLEMYSSIHLIHEPWTLIKDNKVIQIIRPVPDVNSFKTSKSYGPSVGNLIDAAYGLLSDIDLSSSGVFLEKDKSGQIKLFESHPYAITHCRNKIFATLQNNRMYGDKRTDMRKWKLRDKGWKDILELDIKDERKVKISNLGDSQKPDYDYKSYKKYDLKENQNFITMESVLMGLYK